MLSVNGTESRTPAPAVQTPPEELEGWDRHNVSLAGHPRAMGLVWSRLLCRFRRCQVWLSIPSPRLKHSNTAIGRFKASHARATKTRALCKGSPSTLPTSLGRWSPDSAAQKSCPGLEPWRGGTARASLSGVARRTVPSGVKLSRHSTHSSAPPV